MHKILITDTIDDPIFERKVCDQIISWKQSYDPEEVGCILVWHQRIDAEYCSKFPNLKGVVRYGVGFDNIDLEFLKESGLSFSNNPDYGVDEVSDSSLSMLISLARGVPYYQAFLANSSYQSRVQWQANYHGSLKRLSNSKVGIVGVGRIGSAFSYKIRNCVSEIGFFDPGAARGYEKVLKATRFDSLETMAEWCDHLVLHCSSNSSSRRCLNKNIISKLKKWSVVVNCSRGDLIQNYQELLDSVLDNSIFGVGLDCLEIEPPPFDDAFFSRWQNLRWQDRERFIINPHVAFFSNESFEEMRVKAAKLAVKVSNGEKMFYHG